MTRAAPPQLDGRETATAVRRIFDDAGYEAGRIQDRLGTSDRALAEGPDRPVSPSGIRITSPPSMALRRRSPI